MAEGAAECAGDLRDATFQTPWGHDNTRRLLIGRDEAAYVRDVLTHRRMAVEEGRSRDRQLDARHAGVESTFRMMAERRG